jgi:hypothetical protein
LRLMPTFPESVHSPIHKHLPRPEMFLKNDNGLTVSHRAPKGGGRSGPVDKRRMCRPAACLRPFYPAAAIARAMTRRWMSLVPS